MPHEGLGKKPRCGGVFLVYKKGSVNQIRNKEAKLKVSGKKKRLNTEVEWANLRKNKGGEKIRKKKSNNGLTRAQMGQKRGIILVLFLFGVHIRQKIKTNERPRAMGTGGVGNVAIKFGIEQLSAESPTQKNNRIQQRGTTQQDRTTRKNVDCARRAE